MSALLDEMRAVAHQDAAHIVDDFYAFLVSGRDEVQSLFAKVAGVKSLADEARLLALPEAERKAALETVFRDTSEKVAAGVLIARSALDMPAPVASTAPTSHSVGFEAPAGPSAPQA